MPSGDVIIMGATQSSNFTTAAGGISMYGGGPSDLFVARLKKSGELMWSTLLGGDGEEFSGHVGLDPGGVVIVSGTTKSTDFPTTAGMDDTLGGTRDAFLTRLDPETGGIVWSTYLGGSGEEHVTSAIPSPAGPWYIVGHTGSADFPVANAFDDSYGGGTGPGTFATGDVFLGRIDVNGQILSASFVGGSGFDMISSSLGLDPHGNLYVPIQTESGDIP